MQYTDRHSQFTEFTRALLWCQSWPGSFPLRMVSTSTKFILLFTAFGWIKIDIFPSVSSHRPIKIPADWLFHLNWTMVRSNYCSGGIVPPSFFIFFFNLFYDVEYKPAVVFWPNSSLKSAQKTDVLTSSSRPQGRHVLAQVSSHVLCTVKSHEHSMFCRLCS